MAHDTSRATTRVRLSGGIRTFLAAAMAAALVLYALARVFDLGVALFPGDWIVLVLVEAILGAFVASWHQLRLEGDTMLIQWFPYFTRRIPRSELVSVAEAAADSWHANVGARLIGNSSPALLHRGGFTILLEFRSQKFLIALNDDDATIDFVDELRRALPAG